MCIKYKIYYKYVNTYYVNIGNVCSISSYTLFGLVRVYVCVWVCEFADYDG